MTGKPELGRCNFVADRGGQVTKKEDEFENIYWVKGWGRQDGMALGKIRIAEG